MKQYFLLITLSFISFAARSQNSYISPGGVRGATHWYVTDSSSAIQGFRSRIVGDSSFLLLINSASEISSLNFHPSLVFTGLSYIPIDLNNGKFNNATYFTVYHCIDSSKENHIWHVTKNKLTELVSTTSRMADFSPIHYMNFIDLKPQHPKINTYAQSKEKENVSPLERTWYLGNKPSKPELPVNSFRGLIPEVIAFDRVLNRQERLQISSYLALKYGITLTEPDATYLNSAGKIIWDGSKYSSYHNNIAGIGRDDSSGLNQKKAVSSNNPALLYISTQQDLENNSFLLAGDNGKPLTLAVKVAGLPPLLEKKWLMISHGSSRPFTTDIVLDSKQFDVPLSSAPVYWLAIDRSGTGNFSLAGTEFIKMTRLDSKGKVHFKDVTWGKGNAGKEVWTCIPARNLLLSTFIVNPTCVIPADGSVQVKVIGGNAPYHLSIKNGVSQWNEKIASNDISITRSGIAAGRYQLRVVDASGEIYIDSFYVNNLDAPHPATIASSYVMEAGRQLQIDAAEQMPYGLSYQWIDPDNVSSFNPKITITKAGLYTLICSKNGCSYQQEVKVTTLPANVFDNNITVYPNPSQGSFTVKITLDKPAPVEMTIYNSEGKLIATKNRVGVANYMLIHHLSVNGMYTLHFKSGKSETTKPVLIAK